MGLFDQFPYTNFHNLNLDWIIGQIKNIKSAVSSTAKDAASASESAEAAAASAGSAAGSAAYAGNAAALVQQVRDDLDTVNTEMTNFVQAHSGLYNETVLWSGTASATGDTIELSDDIRNYKYIDVQATYKGATSSSSSLGTFPSNVVRFTPEVFTEDNAVLNIPYAYEDQLQICTVFMFWDSLDPTDYTKISLGYTRRVSINDHGDLDNAADPGTVIVKIIGVKNIADAEVIDARVGDDDTVYPTLKQRLDGEYSDLKSAIASSQGMSAEFKVALENLVSHVAFIGDDPTGQTYINALHTAMYPPANLTSISAVYTQSGAVYDTDSLDSLKADLVVTALYDNGTTEIVTSYTLSGTLTEGTSTITVAYGGKSTTFTVLVTNPYEYLVRDYVNESGASNQVFTVENINLSNGDYIEWSLSGVRTVSTGSSMVRCGNNNSGTGLWTYNNGYKYIVYEDPTIGINEITCVVNGAGTAGRNQYTASTTPASADDLIVRIDKDGLLINGSRYSATTTTAYTNLINWMLQQTTLYVGINGDCPVTFNYIRVYRGA